MEDEAASVAMTTLATELTDEEIRDVQEMGVKLQEFVLDSAEDDELQTIRDEDSSAKLLTELEKRPKASETDVDDIMKDSFTLVAAVDCSQNDRGDVKEPERHSETGLPLDDDDDDEDDMKELLRFKRQNSRDYLEQAPIDGLLEGIAEEPEEEGTKEIEEEYDSVVIKDEDEESGSASDAANDIGKETEENETIDNPSPSVVDVVTSVEAVTATVVDIDGEDDIEVHEDEIQTAEPSDQEPHESQNGKLSEVNIVERITEVSSQKQEAKEGENLTVSTELAVEPMDTTTSPSSSGTTSDENVATFEVAKDPVKTSAEELSVTTGQSKNRNHDYVNIGDLDGPSNDLDAETIRRAAKAEISDEDFCFDEASTKSSSEQPDASCDYVNVDTIRANKRLVSRMIQEGNDEEFERLEAEIISKLEDEEDSDYCVPKSTPVAVKSGDTELKQFVDINGSAETDENENLSLSGHQDLLAADAALADKTEDLKTSDITRNEEFKEDEQHFETSEIEQWTCENIHKANGSSEQVVDSDDEIITDYKHPEHEKVISIHEQEKALREEIESCRDDPSLDSFGLQQVKKSNIKSDRSRLASPAYETSSGIRTNDILPEAGSVKALVAQWQQMESKRWSRKDDMKVQNGGEQAESRGMNRFVNCRQVILLTEILKFKHL